MIYILIIFLLLMLIPRTHKIMLKITLKLFPSLFDRYLRDYKEVNKTRGTK